MIPFSMLPPLPLLIKYTVFPRLRQPETRLRTKREVGTDHRRHDRYPLHSEMNFKTTNVSSSFYGFFLYSVFPDPFPLFTLPLL